MNKIKRKEKLKGQQELTLSKGIQEKLVFLSDHSFELEVILEEDSYLEVFHYAKNTSGKIRILLKGKNAKVIYHYNTINQMENEVLFSVLHESPKTESNLFLHGWNQKEEALTFQVDVSIPKGMCESVANQENRIYNTKEGRAKILPNLYIEEYDVEANHASFIGPFAEEDVFYFKTRGLSLEQIERLLTEGLLMEEGLTEEEKLDFFK